MGTLINKQIAGWTLLGPADKRNYWRVRCACGRLYVRYLHSILAGASKQCKACGTATHNQSTTRLYGIWQHMHQRCTNKNNDRFHRYGGRNIEVCSSWHCFDVFRAWSLYAGYDATKTIDRINNNGNYDPDNCQWISSEANSAKNTGWILRSDGVMYRGIVTAAAEHDVSPSYFSTILNRNKPWRGYRFTRQEPVKFI